MLNRSIRGGLIIPILFASISVSANDAEAQTITIQFNNGSPPIKGNEPLSKFGDTFDLSPGESFSVGAGSAFFSFKAFPTADTYAQLTVEMTPGDRVLNLSLPGTKTITTDQPQTTLVFVREGEAMSIAYGFDAEKQVHANVTFTYEGLVKNPPQGWNNEFGQKRNTDKLHRLTDRSSALTTSLTHPLGTLKSIP